MERRSSAAVPRRGPGTAGSPAASHNIVRGTTEQREYFSECFFLQGGLVSLDGRHTLRNFRQLRLAYMADTPDIPAVQESFSQTAILTGEMNRPSVALAELVSSPEGRRRARSVYNRVAACADLFQTRELFRAAPSETAAAKLLGSRFPKGPARSCSSTRAGQRRYVMS